MNLKNVEQTLQKTHTHIEGPALFIHMDRNAMSDGSGFTAMEGDQAAEEASHAEVQ